MRIVPMGNKSDVREALEAVMAEADQLDGIIVLKMYKDTSSGIQTSTMSAVVKAYLCQMLNAHLLKWHLLESEPEDAPPGA